VVVGGLVFVRYVLLSVICFFFFNDTATTEIYTLSLHDALPIWPIEASLDSVQGANAWITMALREGKNREVRRILAHLGVDVNRLIRISYGPFQLLDLKPGEAEPVKRHVLSDQLGARLAGELNLNEPVEEERARRKARNAKRGGDS